MKQFRQRQHLIVVFAEIASWAIKIIKVNGNPPWLKKLWCVAIMTNVFGQNSAIKYRMV